MSPHFYPLITKLAAKIESIWQEHLDLSAYEMPEDLGYVEGKLEGERLIIQNRCYQAPQFRKLHLELAKVGENLDILHCVMFPHVDYPLPIFGTDLISGKVGVSAAIADLSPTLPLLPTLATALQAWQPNFTEPREVPAWGKEIFSEFCLFVRPHGEEEEDLFFQTTTHFCTLVCELASNLYAELAQGKAIASESDRALILQKQLYYCQQQQQNDKTRRILEKAFGKDWAERYMTTVLFDV